jgi:enterochelin esterase-like enzyme
MDIETYRALGLELPAPLEVNGRSRADFVVSLNHAGDAPYNPCPEALAGDEVERGAVAKYADWDQSRLYPGTLRDIYVYKPPHLEKSHPANLIVFNDGAGYLNRTGPVRAARVLDSLHAKSEIAPTVAVFVNPGRPRDATLDASGGAAAQEQRSREYDAMTPLYGRFILEELLPFLERAESMTLATDPARRTICGISSGGICAFTVAWHNPDKFGRVLSHCGSFVNIRGGHNYPYLVRATPRKPIRVFLQSGANDASYITGDWPLANQTMANALAFAGYDHRFEFGSGGHSLRHAGAIFADSLRWLWR